jgi:hypothetical protein
LFIVASRALNVDNFTELLTALAKFAWPLLVAVLVWRLFPAIKKVVESRGFNVKLPGGTEISVQQATDEERRLIGDLTERVADLDARHRELRGQLEQGIAASVDTGTDITGAASLQSTVYVKITPSSEGPSLQQAERILWIGAPVSASEVALLVEQGVNVEFVGSYERAQHLLEVTGRSYDVIISRLYKDEGGLPKEGLADDVLTEQVRYLNSHAPVIFYDELLASVAKWSAWVGSLGAQGLVRDLPELDRELRKRGMTVFRSAAEASSEPPS